VVSLGCDKNTVDTEKMLFYLKESGFNLTTDAALAEIIIINTCAFIQAAREESIDAILSYAKYKDKNCRRLVVTGCLPQKYITEIFDDLCEVDAFLGTRQYDKIARIIRALDEGGDTAAGNGAGKIAGGRINAVSSAGGDFENNRGRVLSTPKSYAYLKIAEGCDNRCTYCTIPSIRGAYRSFDLDALLSEVGQLADCGVRELILVAQDTTKYGFDLYGDYKLPLLLQKLSRIEKIKRIRLMYCYPELVTAKLIDEIASNPKICKYIDIPLQHIDDGILRLMGRGGARGIKNILKSLTEKIPDISIRSTFIVGFPTETERQFQSLYDFVSENLLTNVGFFEYCAEQGTKAAALKGQISDKTKKDRFDRLSLLNQKLIYDRQSKKIGGTTEVIIDRYDEKAKTYVGRDQYNAPDVDTVIYVESKKALQAGDLHTVRLTKSAGYDLVGQID
jgi:ribosomal protein S12 methylthiotransferase